MRGTLIFFFLDFAMLAKMPTLMLSGVLSGVGDRWFKPGMFPF